MREIQHHFTICHGIETGQGEFLCTFVNALIHTNILRLQMIHKNKKERKKIEAILHRQATSELECEQIKLC